MAKGDFLSQRQQGIVKRYYEHLDTINVNKLSELVSDLYLTESPEQREKLWEFAGRALERLNANPSRVRKVMADRDVTALAQLVNELALAKPGSPARAADRPAEAVLPRADAAPVPAPADPDTPSPETLRSALKAFRKRLKLTRLDEDSKLGRSPLTGGSRSQIVAITPPTQFPKPVWDELARQGKLRASGRGFYELVE